MLGIILNVLDSYYPLVLRTTQWGQVHYYSHFLVEETWGPERVGERPRDHTADTWLSQELNSLS